MNRRRPNPRKEGFRRIGMASYEIHAGGQSMTVRRVDRKEYLVAPSDLLAPGKRVGLTHSEQTLTDAMACAKWLLGIKP